MKRNRPAFGPVIAATLALGAGSYFTYAAMQGDHGLFNRIEADATIAALTARRDALQAELSVIENRTRRLSNDYLDLDLLDQQARDILGLVRADEVVLR